MQYEICIGQMYYMENQMHAPKRTIIISEDQRNIIVLFADKSIDKDGYPIYTINGCEFKIQASFEDRPYFKQKQT